MSLALIFLLQVFTSIGTTSQIQQTAAPTLVQNGTTLRLVAPSIYAEDNQAVGDLAYVNCMLGVGSTDMLCAPQRSAAMTNDAIARWNTAFAALMAYKGGNGPTTDQILAASKLHWLRGPQ